MDGLTVGKGDEGLLEILIALRALSRGELTRGTGTARRPGVREDVGVRVKVEVGGVGYGGKLIFGVGLVVVVEGGLFAAPFEATSRSVSPASE